MRIFMEKENVCPICGEPTYLVYGKHPRKDGLCKKHGDMANFKQIEQCPACGKWHLTNEPCDCEQSSTFTELPTEGFTKCVSCGAETNGYAFCRKCFKKYSTDEMLEILNHTPDLDDYKNSSDTDYGEWEEVSIDEEETEAENNELTCIACGKPSNGKHFCFSCYQKYKDREIEVHFKHCIESYVSDEYCNRKYTCDDGRKVRSKSEKIISDFFFKYKIRAIYEKSVFYYSSDGKTIELKPDFYLPDYDIYLEHNGLNNQSYKANKERTQQMYRELNYNVIITTEDDLEDIERVLKPKLKIN